MQIFITIVPLALLLFGLLGAVITLNCIWRTTGRLRKVSSTLLAICVLYVIVAGADFFIVKINTLYVITASTLILVAIDSVIVTSYVYGIIRSVERGKK